MTSSCLLIARPQEPPSPQASVSHSQGATIHVQSFTSQWTALILTSSIESHHSSQYDPPPPSPPLSPRSTFSGEGHIVPP